MVTPTNTVEVPLSLISVFIFHFEYLVEMQDLSG